MQTWSARRPTATRWPRDRFGDIIGVLPQGLSSVLDRYWNGEAWVRRQLGDTPVIMETIRAELMEAAIQTYVNRCVTMSTWWSSEVAASHRISRIQELATRRHKQVKRKHTRDLKKFDEARKKAAKKRKRSPTQPGPVVDSIASRLSRVRRSMHYGPYVAQKSVQEYAAEKETECRVSSTRAPDLPWF